MPHQATLPLPMDAEGITAELQSVPESSRADAVDLATAIIERERRKGTPEATACALALDIAKRFGAAATEPPPEDISHAYLSANRADIEMGSVLTGMGEAVQLRDTVHLKSITLNLGKVDKSRTRRMWGKDWVVGPMVEVLFATVTYQGTDELVFSVDNLEQMAANARTEWPLIGINKEHYALGGIFAVFDPLTLYVADETLYSQPLLAQDFVDDYAAGRFLGLSPELALDARSRRDKRKLGMVLTGCAFTNKPQLDNIRPRGFSMSTTPHVDTVNMGVVQTEGMLTTVTLAAAIAEALKTAVDSKAYDDQWRAESVERTAEHMKFRQRVIEQVAEEAGVTTEVVSAALETDKDEVDDGLLEAFAKVLDVPAESLRKAEGAEMAASKTTTLDLSAVTTALNLGADADADAALEAIKAAHTERVELAAKVEASGAKVAELSAQVEALTAAKAGAETAVAQKDTTIAELSATVDTVKADLDAMKTENAETKRAAAQERVDLTIGRLADRGGINKDEQDDLLFLGTKGLDDADCQSRYEARLGAYEARLKKDGPLFQMNAKGAAAVDGEDEEGPKDPIAAFAAYADEHHDGDEAAAAATQEGAKLFAAVQDAHTLRLNAVH